MRAATRGWGSFDRSSKACRRFLGARVGISSMRWYSSDSHDHNATTFNVSCGSAGHITVDVYNSHALSSASTPLIVYLPPTGSHAGSNHPPIPPFLLSNSQLDYPLARVNYRWNHLTHPANSNTSSPVPLTSSPEYANHPFPTPLHDVFHAWSWLTGDYLATIKSDSSSNYPTPPPSPNSYKPTSRPQQRPILIFGSYLGGTLATSLALTESHISRTLPTTIPALIIYNGIFNWTQVATTHDPLLANSSPNPSPQDISPTLENALQDSLANSAPYTLQTLHTLKTQLFNNPASAFDSFASPALFFRSPGLSIPSYFPGMKPSPASLEKLDVEGLSLSEGEKADLLAMIGAEADLEGSNGRKGRKANEEEVIEVGRKSHLKFPPAGSGMRIPKSLFLYSSTPEGEGKVGQKGKIGKGGKSTKGKKGSEVKQQTEEIVSLMRRSVVAYEFKDKVMWEGDLDPHSVSEERVQLREIGKGVEGMEDVVREYMAGLD